METGQSGRCTFTDFALTMTAPKPRPGKISTLLAWPGVMVLPLTSTGSNGEPVHRQGLL